MARPDRIEAVLLDASCLIGLISGEEQMAPLRSLLGAIDRSEIRLVESTAILAEVLPTHDRGDPNAREEILQLLESAAVELVDVSAPIAKRAADLRVRLGLHTWDAIHLATAVVAGVDMLVVRDRRFPIGETVDGVYVSGPFNIDDDKLDLDLQQ